jgi:hypothetical protein
MKTEAVEMDALSISDPEVLKYPVSISLLRRFQRWVFT